MRFKQFISEESEFSAKKIVSDCAPWFKANAPSHYIIWHGTSSFKKESMLIRNRPRSNPSNSSIQIHNTVNRILQIKFGWLPRTEGLFVSGDRNVSSVYGKAYACYPVGDFKFVWSPDIADLFMYWKSYVAKHKHLHISEITRKFAYDLENSIEWKNTDIRQAITSGHEIIINASAFYLVDTDSDFYKRELSVAVGNLQ